MAQSAYVTFSEHWGKVEFEYNSSQDYQAKDGECKIVATPIVDLDSYLGSSGFPSEGVFFVSAFPEGQTTKVVLLEVFNTFYRKALSLNRDGSFDCILRATDRKSQFGFGWNQRFGSEDDRLGNHAIFTVYIPEELESTLVTQAIVVIGSS